MSGRSAVRCSYLAASGIWALFNLGIDSKLRGCDLVSLRVVDVAPPGRAIARTTVRQKKTGRPVVFELTEHTREAVDVYLRTSGRPASGHLFPGRGGTSPHMSTRQYARLLDRCPQQIGLDPGLYGTHSLRRTKATLIYKRTVTFARSNCSWATPRSRAPCPISALR
jgi:integrase